MCITFSFLQIKLFWRSVIDMYSTYTFNMNVKLQFSRKITIDNDVCDTL